MRLQTEQKSDPDHLTSPCNGNQRRRDPRVERRRLLLRHVLHPAVKLGCGGLKEAVSFSIPKMWIASNSRSTPTASAVAVYSGLANGHRDVALGGEVMDLVRADLLHQAYQIG